MDQRNEALNALRFENIEQATDIVVKLMEDDGEDALFRAWSTQHAGLLLNEMERDVTKALALRRKVTDALVRCTKLLTGNGSIAREAVWALANDPRHAFDHLVQKFISDDALGNDPAWIALQSRLIAMRNTPSTNAP